MPLENSHSYVMNWFQFVIIPYLNRGSNYNINENKAIDTIILHDFVWAFTANNNQQSITQLITVIKDYFPY